MCAALEFGAFVTPAKAQVFDGVEPQSSLISVRLGVGRIVGANVAYDYALARVWKGTFTIGAQVDYMWDNFDRKGANMHTINAMIRTTYRFNVVVPEWEVYGGVGLGGGAWFNKNAGQGVFAGTAILGTTYYFAPNVGVNLEFDLGGVTGSDYLWWDNNLNPHMDGGAFLWPWLNLGFTFKL